MAALLITALMITGILFLVSDEGVDATITGTGTQADPYTYIDCNARELDTALGNSDDPTRYVASGSTVSVTSYSGDPSYTITGVTSGHGLTLRLADYRVHSLVATVTLL